jgi:hypothetical protein
VGDGVFDGPAESGDAVVPGFVDGVVFGVSWPFAAGTGSETASRRPSSARTCTDTPALWRLPE